MLLVTSRMIVLECIIIESLRLLISFALFGLRSCDACHILILPFKNCLWVWVWVCRESMERYPVRVSHLSPSSQRALPSHLLWEELLKKVYSSNQSCQPDLSNMQRQRVHLVSQQRTATVTVRLSNVLHTQEPRLWMDRRAEGTWQPPQLGPTSW